MAKEKVKKIAIFHSNPDNPGWDFWGFSNPGEAEKDIRLARNEGNQTVAVEVLLPEVKRNKKEVTKRHDG